LPPKSSRTAEVVVEGAETDVGSFEDVLDTGLLEATLPKEAHGGVHDRLALPLLLPLS
jgi:hypothetical protein